MPRSVRLVIGLTLFCGVVIAMLAENPPPPPPPHTEVIINGDVETDGVDTPWFELSKGGGDTVSWKNATGNDCLVIYPGQTPFDTNPIIVVAGTTSPPKSATNAKDPRPGWPPGKVYKFYKYSIACQAGGGIFDPGNGVKP